MLGSVPPWRNVKDSGGWIVVPFLAAADTISFGWDPDFFGATAAGLIVETPDWLHLHAGLGEAHGMW